MSSLATPSVEAWQYRETGTGAVKAPKEILEAVAAPAAPPGISEAEVVHRIQQAINEAEQRWIAEDRKREAERKERLRAVIDAFFVERSRYFRQVEEDVVQLALAVARKILQREAALDPTLLRGLVRIALDRVGAEESVRIRLSTEQAQAWDAVVSAPSGYAEYKVVADEMLAPGDCIIETDRGSVNCGVEEQLKGIEQSFHDLLARRPETAG